MGISGSYSVGCGSAALRTEGQSCSDLVGCDKGLYCDMKDFSAAGSCVKLPASCATGPSCDCLKPIYDACLGGHHCSVLGDVASVACL